jgi:hypothetical protein
MLRKGGGELPRHFSSVRERKRTLSLSGPLLWRLSTLSRSHTHTWYSECVCVIKAV